MSEIPWTPGPYGLNALSRATHAPERTALFVVHHLTAGTRLADVIPLVEQDHRIQTILTAAPGSPFARSGEEYISSLGGVVIPWQVATANTFDLAVAASPGHQMVELHAPILTLEHGIGPANLTTRADGHGPPAPRFATGLIAGGLVTHGRVIPSTLGVAHEGHRDALARLVPELNEVTRVVGDPCYDRLLASLPERAEYRRALGVADDQSLVMVSSTLGRHSLLGRDLSLPAALANALPPERYRVVVAPHPGVWEWHGRRQVRAWLAHAQRQGVALLPPEEGWGAALVASDLVIGDHGSVTLYGAALGRPVLIAAPNDEVHPGSAIDLLDRATPHLDHGSALEPQVYEAIGGHVPDRAAWFAPTVSEIPGKSAARIREAMYQLMGLGEPDTPPRTVPVPFPRPLPHLEGEPR